MPIFMIVLFFYFYFFFSDFVPNSYVVVTVTTSMAHDALCISYLLSHQNTPYRKI